MFVYVCFQPLRLPSSVCTYVNACTCTGGTWKLMFEECVFLSVSVCVPTATAAPLSTAITVNTLHLSS